VSPSPGWRRLFRLPRFSRRVVERDVDDELEFHLAMRAEKLRRLGADERTASAAALARFGDPSRVRDECITIDRGHVREVHMKEWLESIRSDVRYALRTLRRAPGFTTVAALTLALGIGTTTAMFSLVDGILLRPLPYPHSDRLVRLIQAYPEKGLDRWPLSQANLALYRDRMHEFESFAGYSRSGATFGDDGHRERLSVVRATGDFFDVLGVKPFIGRPFGRAEDTPGTNNVVVLSYGFWQTRFAGDQRVLGRVIDLDGTPRRVIGVMPDGFAFPRSDAQVYVPLGLDPTRRFGFFITGIGRLAPGATIEAARRSSTALMWEWTSMAPGLLPAGMRPRDTRMTTLVAPYRDAMTADVARPLTVLQAAVALILLIAIANVATLLSSRSAARARETALRNALGATRGRVVRQLLTESVTLALLGGVAGMGLAYALVRVVTHSDAVTLPRLGEVSVNWRVLWFALSAAVAAGLAFGIAPALSLARGRPGAALAAGRTDTGSGHASSRRVNNALVAAQLALSVVLLVAAGLVLKSFRHLVTTDLGFEPAGVTTIALPLPAEKYSDPGEISDVVTQLASRVRTVPGVRNAAIAWTFPFSGNVNTDGYIIEGHTDVAAVGFETQVVLNAITPGYFGSLRIPLLYGRDFSFADRDSVLPVAIVNEALASRYWRGAEAIGKRMRVTGDTTWRTIVGVVGSVRDEDVALEPRPQEYAPYAQTPDPRPMLAIRTSGEPGPVIAAVRRAIAQVEPGIPLDNVRPLGSWISRALDTRRMTELLLIGFGMLAVLLASVGIFGVMSLYVTNRYREFGIRLAVGAEPRNLVRLVLREGATLTIAGLVIGICGALPATKWLGTLLYDVSPTDPIVFVLLPLALGSIAVASCYLPARRAAQSDPLTVLRAD